jgi:hypothetical protein
MPCLSSKSPRVSATTVRQWPLQRSSVARCIHKSSRRTPRACAYRSRPPLASPQAVIDALPRRLVRPGPLSPRPSATIEEAAAAAIAATASTAKAAGSAPAAGEAAAQSTAPEGAAASAAGGYAACEPGELCTVCHEAFEPGRSVAELPCRHCFHAPCIEPWLRQVRGGRRRAREWEAGPGAGACLRAAQPRASCVEGLKSAAAAVGRGAWGARLA